MTPLAWQIVGKWTATWKTPVAVRGSRVYWFDDTGRGACRLPASWQLQYRDGDAWKPVAAAGNYPIVKNGWNEVSFRPITTSALRLAVQLPKGWAAGVHEWKVEESDDD